MEQFLVQVSPIFVEFNASYFKLMKGAAEHDITVSISYFKRKYHDLYLNHAKIKESLPRLNTVVVQRSVDLKDSGDKEIPEEVQTLPHKK